MKANIIYVDMESLFDLRQGFLATHVEDKEKVMDYLLSEEYNFREVDTFPFTLSQRYTDVIKQPTKELLEASSITRIFLSLKQKIDSIENRNKYYNESKEAQILLNLYPFTFTDEEAEHIRNLLFVKLGTECTINITNLSLKALTPIYIKMTGIVSLFIYDFKEWFKEHANALKTIQLHDTLFYFPAVYDKLPTEEEMKKINKLGFRDPMSYLEYILSPVTSVNFLPAVFYSNVVTALGHLEKFDGQLKNEFVNEEAEDTYDDILSKIPVP